jgi:hypothetical protein
MDDLKEKSLEGSDKPETDTRPPEEKEQEGSFGDYIVR